MLRLHTAFFAACVLVTACGSPSAPTTATTARAQSIASSSSGFGTIVSTSNSGSPADFARCLGGSSEVACFARVASGNGRFAASAIPTAPTGLVASAVGSTVTLTWTAPNGTAVSAYIIEAGASPGLANLANFSTGNTLTTFQASGIGAGTYYVRVRAVTASGVSDVSNEATLIVGGTTPCVTPGAPSSLALTFNSGGVVGFSWTAGSGSPTTYIVEAGSASGLANLANSDLGSPALSMTATGVGNGTYYVRLRSKNACGTSGPSNEVTLVVGPSRPALTVTLLVTPGVAGTASSFSVTTTEIVRASWTFGDGSSAVTTTAAPFVTTHVYSAAGSYAAAVTVTDSFGQTASDSRVVTISGTTIPTTPTTTSQPSVTTSAATGIDETDATLTGVVNPNGLSTTAFFQWGTSTNYGNTTSSQTGTGSSSVSLSSALSGLASSTTYHYRLVARNSAGTTNGGDLTFTTLTPTPTSRTRIGAICNDGTLSTATGSGACSSHGGVRCWRYTDGTCTNP